MIGNGWCNSINLKKYSDLLFIHWQYLYTMGFISFGYIDLINFKCLRELLSVDLLQKIDNQNSNLRIICSCKDKQKHSIWGMGVLSPHADHAITIIAGIMKALTNTPGKYCMIRRLYKEVY